MRKQLEMMLSFKLTLLSRNVVISFPNVGHNLPEVEIQWAPSTLYNTLSL